MPGLAGTEIGLASGLMLCHRFVGSALKVDFICLWMRLQAQKWGSTSFNICASSWGVVTVLPFALISKLLQVVPVAESDASGARPDCCSVAASMILGQPPAN